MIIKIIKVLSYISYKLLNINKLQNIRNYYTIFYTFYVRRSFKNIGTGGIIKPFRSLREPENIELGDNIKIGKDCVFELYSHFNNQTFQPTLKIGNNSAIGDDSHITCINKIIIGNNVRMGRKVFITDNAHGASEASLMDIAPNKRDLVSKGPVLIEDNVWIGEMVCIMPNVKIGQGSILGANSVITKDVPPYSVVTGPAATIRKTLKNPIN